MAGPRRGSVSDRAVCVENPLVVRVHSSGGMIGVGLFLSMQIDRPHMQVINNKHMKTVEQDVLHVKRVSKGADRISLISQNREHVHLGPPQ